MTEPTGLDLLGNAYSFINESLRCAQGATEDPARWKFAVVHATQALELFFKERLRRVHPLFVYSNVDKPRHTVSLELAMERLASCGVQIEADELKQLREARDFRNAIVHFDINVTNEQLKAAYIVLLEFAHSFLANELEDEIHAHTERDLWATEAALMSEFQREFVPYNGMTIIRRFPLEII
ncbi:hypothetical protein [Amycolatopsis coloradensis]|uniref:hypothetical protein n=1 Tax=Amycolatopsis coloradensis TaxID=76021 RepID=UPI0011789E0F|nr:hypothetical protein [Amycolatopsis coloradensis]